MKKSQQYNSISISFVMLCIVFLCLFLRLGADYFSVGDYLWAEDGNVFINAALQWGVFSFVQPYGGYLHLYPRFFALVAKYAGPEGIPYILFMGWIVAFLLMSFIIMNRVLTLGLGAWVGFVIIALISLHPHNGEAFFNITNAQWFLGIALAIYILVDSPQKLPRYFEIPLLIVLSLTGPFSILLLPAILIKVVVFKNFKQNAVAYWTVIICALLQMGIIFYSENSPATLIDSFTLEIIIIQWIFTLITFLSFGGGGFVGVLALIFWTTTIYIFVRSFFISDLQLKRNRKVALIIIFAALLILFVAILRTGASLSSSPGSRYYIIPYALSFFSIAIVGYYFKWARMILIITIGLICFIQFQSFVREPLQFAAFAQFARYKNDLNIPIHPWRWHINMGGYYNDPLQQITKQSLLPSTSNSSQIVLGVLSCPGARYVGTEITLWQNRAGILQLFWGLDEQFTEKNSLRRFYLDGLVKTQFAFKNIGDQVVLRLDQIGLPGISGFGKELQIKKVDIYCLP